VGEDDVGSYGLEDAHRLRNDFLADAVAGDDCDSLLALTRTKISESDRDKYGYTSSPEIDN